MKRLTYILLSLLVLAACTSTSRNPQLVAADSLLLSSPDSALTLLRNMSFSSTPDRMYHYLLLADAANKCYDTLPSDTILQEVADFYDRHGSANEQVRAHYMLGCAYRDMGEAPMALQCYQQAIDRADTTAHDCNFALLSKVYGQTGQVFYYQRLGQKQLPIINQAIEYAFRAKDTLTAMSYYWQKYHILEERKETKIAIATIDTLAMWYKYHNMIPQYARAKGRSIYLLIHENENNKVVENMNTYEQSSDLFDSESNIEAGREIYYYYKGLFFLNINAIDSAEFYFRKELQCGKDYNNQNAGSHGLSMLFQRKHLPDSAAKYALYSYAMNDSMYAQMATDEVARMQAMYDYSRHQEIARKETEKALLERNKRLLTMLLLLLCVSVASFIIYNMYKEKKESKKRYHNTLERLERTQSEVLQLRDMASDYSELKCFVEEKEQEIEHLKSQLNQDQQKTLQSRAEKEEQIKRSKIFQSLLKKSRRGLPLCNEELRACRIMVIDCLPELNNLLLSKQNYLNSKGFNFCVLFRLGFQSKEISNMLSVSPARISQMSASILSKLFRLNEGGAKELIAKLSELY